MGQRIFLLIVLIFISLQLSYVHVLAINIHHNIRISTNGCDSSNCLDPSNTSAACKTLDYVLSQIERNTSLGNSTVITIESGLYRLNRSYSFENLNSFQIIGVYLGVQVSSSQNVNNVVIQCNMGSGLAFLHSENLAFSYLTFQNCGSWQNNTSISNPKFLAAIFIVYSKNLKVIGCHISKSPGVGVNLYDVSGDVFLENCTFKENYAFDSWNFTYLDGRVRAGGGLHIEFTYCGALYPFECSDVETDKYNHGNNYTIRNCNFTDNNGTTAHRFKQTFNVNPCEKDFNSIGRGGGISFIIKGNATGNRFFIDDCTFLRNTADWGGGYALYFQDNASNNSLRVSNSRFLRNTARYGGGAIKCATTIFGTFQDLTSREANYYFHEICIFERNMATEGWGGAFSAFGSTGYLGTQGWKTSKTPVFVNCHWRENSATAGAAIGTLTKPPELWRKSAGREEQGFGFALKLVNNTFTKNFIIPTICNVTVFGMGTIYSVFVPIIMTGDVKFVENNNTALLLDSACAEIDGNVSFHKNNGVYGGAVGIYGASAFVLMPGSKLMFQENSASAVAGAIYVKTAGPDIAAFYQTIFQRHRCFFRYFDSSVDPNHWNVSVVFQGNNASRDIGRTLFANTLQFCRFGRSGLINHAIKSWKSFKFQNHDGRPSNDELEVATDPVQILINPPEWNNVSPNEKFSPSIQLLDERNHSVYGLIKVSIKEQSTNEPVSIDSGVSSFFFVKDRINSLWLSGKPSSIFDASITSLYSQSIKMTLRNLTVKKCSPGFIDKDNSCVCSIVEDRVAGISRCGKDGKSLYLRKGYWGGPRHGDANQGKSCLFSVEPCPYGYCKCGSNGANGLSNHCECYLNATINQCVKGRKGILCGECEEGLSVVIGSYECIPCKKKDTLMLIPFFLILTFLVFLVLYFKLDFFSGYLNCWLYTYQIIFLLVPDHLLVVDPFVNFIVQLTNIRFVFGSWCLWDGMNDLQKTSFGYVAPVYQIFVLFVFAKLSSRFSIFPGNFFRPFCTILVLSYSGIVNVTFKQLNPVYICSEWRVYMTAGLKFFKGEHIIHASLAIVVLLLVVVPFPIMLSHSSFFTNRSRLFSRISMPLLDVLKSCYHPKRSWFAAYYIVCRLIAVLLHTFIPEINARHKILQIFCVTVLLLFLYLKPYKSDILTKIDTFFLSFLVIISLLADVIITCSFFVSLFYHICFYCIHILLYVPFVYSLILLYYHVRNLVRQRKQRRGNNMENYQPVINESGETESRRYEPL